MSGQNQSKILLINPNFHYFPGWLENMVNYKKTPLGLAYLAAYVRKKYPVDMRICDAYALNLSEGDVVRFAQEFTPDIVGVTVTTPTVRFARSVTARIKKILPGVLTIYGGPHVSALPFENLDVADVCVIGEGEQTFAELVEGYLAGSGYEGIKGVAFKKNSHAVKTQERGLIEDLDTLPFPARDLLPRNFFPHIYPYPYSGRRAATIMTSRGCHFKCSFCANEFMWKSRVRYRSLDNVFEEIDHLVGRYQCEFLYLYDDCFTSDPARVIEFSRRKQKYFPALKWFCHSRADSLNQEVLGEMRGGGCAEVQVGVESGDDGILESYNKKIKTETVRRAFDLLKKNGINQWATFIIGNPQEREATVEKTIRFAIKLDPTYASFMFLSPLPGTRSFEELSKKKAITTYNWEEYNWHTAPVFETEFLSKKSMSALRKRAYRKFYLRPRALCRYAYILLTTRQARIMLTNLCLLIKFSLGMNKNRRHCHET